MKKIILCSIAHLFVVCNLLGQNPASSATIAAKTTNFQKYEGYFDYYWDEANGKIWLEIEAWDTEFLYVHALAAGVGSNDIGLDRGQLGGSRIVKFHKVGPKVLLIEPNYGYRAISNNPDERKAVEQAFAQSVLWGFKVEVQEGGKVLVDATDFFMQDAHGVVQTLSQRNQGSYKLDASRSAIYLPMCKNFPKNTELEATLTFTGEPKGAWIRSVTPTPEAVTVRQHHSFIELPDNNYQPRVFDPRSGYFGIEFFDYATPIQEPIAKRYIRRHRLEKKNPNAKMSEAVEPIVYYVDRGAPEPIKSALIEGASWWNQAFEAAGYQNAFIVKEMPADADPLDVRYNVIQWVHRSTRGWSYGASVYDPRTGEIIKGHVSLGSLRVRQDFLIAQGLVQPYENGTTPDPRLLEMSLARLRQLSAHEVGHTIGIAHNFAASTNNRASVMDYPHPAVELKDNGTMDFSSSYAVGIGDWDKQAVLYGYQHFPKGTNEASALQGILKETIAKGLHYISDEGARPYGSAHPLAHLWDNGISATAELNRLIDLRAKALSQFSEKNIPVGAPMATLENVLVPLYLSHRYQTEAAAKLIAGVQYAYAARGDGQVVNEVVAATAQREALKALLRTLEPKFLALPESIIRLLPPQPIGYERSRENFETHTGLTFDPIAAAETAANHSLTLLLHPERLARLVEQSARQKIDFNLNDYLDQILTQVVVRTEQTPFEQEVARMTQKLLLNHLLRLAAYQDGQQQVNAVILAKLNDLRLVWSAYTGSDIQQIAHYTYLFHQLKQFTDDPKDFKMPALPKTPDGQPIGCGE